MLIKRLMKILKLKPTFNITRTEIINFLIKKYSYKTYLEIGVNDPNNNFNKIKIKFKDGVDPIWRRNPRKGNKYEMESDQFFALLNKNKLYDIIFIDGLHTYEQAKKDIAHSLNHLSSEGTIIVHDCNPPSKWHQRNVEEVKDNEEWYGTTWKAFVENRIVNPQISMMTVDIDCGCGIIKFGSQTLYNKVEITKCLTWDYFKNNKNKLLQLTDVNTFFK